jgi:GxxExxY protein
METNHFTECIIGASIEVHRILGPGLLESAYEECLCRELDMRSIAYQRQVPLPIYYKGKNLDCGYRLDLLVGDEIVVEIKAIDHLLPVHEAQVITYLKLGGWHIGLLINFNTPVLKQGIKRLVHNYTGEDISAHVVSIQK